MTPDQAAADVPTRAERVEHAVRAWTSQLVELGGRNSLLWYRDLPSGTLDLAAAHPAGLAGLIAGRSVLLSTLFREPKALAEAQRRARSVAARVEEARDERGVDTGFLAIGMASWRVGGSREPCAPVLLRACRLGPVPGRADHRVELGEDVEVNPVLLEYLSSQHGIDLEAAVVEDAARGAAGFDAARAHDLVLDRCRDVPGFRIDPRAVVASFPYTKLPSVADLTAAGPGLAEHDVIAALAGDTQAAAALARDRGRPIELDTQAAADPGRLPLVLDADADQVAAMQAVLAGRHLLIQGPPGTGKSQTIANLLAVLAAHGKRVLFVAEKRAAIDAVLGRLDSVELGDMVLDLHGGVPSQRALARDLVGALDAVARTEPMREVPLGELATRRHRHESELSAHVAALHGSRGIWGVSAHDAQERISELTRRPHAPRSHVRIPADRLRHLSPTDRDEAASRLVRAVELGAWTDRMSRDDHERTQGDPWFGARILTAEDAARARDITTRWAHGGLEQTRRTVAEVLSEVRLSATDSVTGWGRTLETIAAVRDTLETFRPEVFDLPLVEMVAASADRDERRRRGIDQTWSQRWRLRRQARSLLRPGRPPADLHGALRLADEQRTAWREMAGPGGRPEVPADLPVARSAFTELVRDLTWLQDRLPAAPLRGERNLATGVDSQDDEPTPRLLELPVGRLAAELNVLADHLDRLAVLPQVVGTLDQLRQRGWAAVIDDLATRGVPAERVADEVALVWWASIADDIAATDPRYGVRHDTALRREVADFREADRELIGRGADLVRNRVAARVRARRSQSPAEETLIRQVATRGVRVREIATLLERATETLMAVKPCWVMSPLAVASTLPAGSWFDVVVMDEASQIPPAHAISALSRARQVVVAGDSSQLPPTRLFTTTGDDDVVDVATGGMESILDALAATLPTTTLRWHYRSRDERLISFVNETIYDSDLVTFPGTGIDPVVRFVHVDGQGAPDTETASVESTSAEVETVCDLVVDHLRTRPEMTLGVVALGMRHLERLQDGLRRRAAGDAAVAAALHGDGGPGGQRILVKNLERVQGDERDAIILSIGFGPTPHGRVVHRFGPVSASGGERRLTVALTRARERMTVVSSLRAEDLDPERLTSAGPRMLRDLLAHAQAQSDPREPKPTTGVPTCGRLVLSEFADRLRREGLVVHEAVGAGRHRIGLAVESVQHPGRLAVAVEDDGPEYAAIPSVRDRERLRPEHLERLGWSHVRVWGEDIYRNPAPDVVRVVAAAGAAASSRYPEPDQVGQEDETHDADDLAR